jgi:hypothetical protein
MRKPLTLTRPILLFTLAFMTGCGRPDAGPADESSIDEETPKVSFSEVAEEVGLGSFTHTTGSFGKKWFPESMGSGVAVIDFDTDGWPDLMLASGGVWPESNQPAPPAVRLFRNDGSRFVEAESGVVPADAAYTFGVTAADYDNDGDTDAFVTVVGRNLLYRNDGGRFKEVGRESGIADRPGWSTAAVFFDADRDGWLDLFVGNYVHWSPEDDLWCSTTGQEKMVCTPEIYEGIPAEFYRNKGDGTFEDLTTEAGFGDTGKTLGVIAVDYDDDRWPDLLVANDTDPDQLFRNQGDGTFVDMGVRSGIAFDERGRARAGMGVAAGYVDDTGELSVFVANFSDEMVGVYRNLGEGVFMDRAAVSGIGRVTLRTLGFGMVLFDADLDACADVLVVNGHIQSVIGQIRDNLTYRQAPHLFLNDCDGVFVDAAEMAGLTEPIVGRGAAYVDYDRDGDVDVVATENGGRVRLWRNDVGSDQNSVRIRLRGTDSNRQGIGAGVVAYSPNKVQRRMITAGSSYLSSSEAVATFGFDTARPDSVVVTWPAGRSTVVTEPKPGIEYLVQEDGEVVESWSVHTE